MELRIFLEFAVPPSWDDSVLQISRGRVSGRDLIAGLVLVVVLC